MSRFTNLVFWTGATLSAVVAARSCDKNYYYCGKSLLNIGRNYIPIVNALKHDDMEGEEFIVVMESLFRCTGGTQGEVSIVKSCDECHDAGSLSDDYCIDVPDQMVPEQVDNTLPAAYPDGEELGNEGRYYLGSDGDVDARQGSG